MSYAEPPSDFSDDESGGGGSKGDGDGEGDSSGNEDSEEDFEVRRVLNSTEFFQIFYT